MPNPIATFKEIKAERAARPKELSLLYGEQDQIDILSYAGLEEQADHLILDGTFVRSLTIAGYPFIARSGWLDSLINFNHDADISYHFHEVNAVVALPDLRRKITQLESTRRQKIKDGQIISSELTDPLESAIELRDKILRGQEKLFQLGLYICLRATTLAELDKITKQLMAQLSAFMFNVKVARYKQLDGLQSILPRAEDKLNDKRNLDSSSAALTFPFISSELVQESGILYGINKSSNSLVILDRYKLQNANSIVFAQSGSGKSYATKVEILRQLMNGTKVIVIDPEREYQALSKSVSGTYIKLSINSKQKINPFDLATTSHHANDLAEHVQDLTEVIGLMVGSLSDKESAALDKAILKVYQTAKTDQPVLKDLYDELHRMKQRELCTNLEKYITGSLAKVFNGQTNIKLDNRLVVFDIKDLPNSIWRIMIIILSNFVANQVKAKPEKRLLIIDEGWLLLEKDESASFIAGLVRRARKYYLGVSIISQQANDFLESKYGRVIASQSALRILMRQDTTTIEKVTTEFHLSEWERNFLLTCERGEALIIADQHHVAVRVIASDKEHPLITTDPAEIFIK